MSASILLILQHIAQPCGYTLMITVLHTQWHVKGENRKQTRQFREGANILKVGNVVHNSHHLLVSLSLYVSDLFMIWHTPFFATTLIGCRCWKKKCREYKANIWTCLTVNMSAIHVLHMHVFAQSDEALLMNLAGLWNDFSETGY